MRISHIIPSFYDYFNDINEVAFSLVDGINALGQESKPTTLQYGPPSKEMQERIQEVAPTTAPIYTGEVKFEEVINEFAGYDIIHLHSPFLGAAGKLLDWKKRNPNHPFLVTYYRDVVFTDMIALGLRWYDAYYLPKIFAAADVVTCFSADDFFRSSGARYLADKDKLFALGGAFKTIHLTEDTYDVKLINKDEVIQNLISVYEELIN